MRVLVLLLACLNCCLPLAATPRHYRVTDIGPGTGLKINDHGEIAGSVDSGIQYSANHGLRGFLWVQGKRTDLGLPPGYTSTIVRAINNHGEITGNLDDTIDGAALVVGSHAFLWKHGKLRDLGTPDDDAVSEALGINDRGEIIGSAYVSGRPVEDDPALTEHHAFVYRHGTMIDLGPGEASAINTRGQIVGETPGPVYLDAARWDKGRLVKLGVHGVAQAINDKGQIVVMEGVHPYLWQNGHGERLPLPPGVGGADATAINIRGQIIGSACEPTSRALLWQQGQVYDLNALISPRSGWVLMEATGINNKGQIVGNGLLHGKERGFLLTPLRH